MNSTLKTEFHHWWPKSLLKFWASDDDRITAISPNGKTIRAPYNGQAFWGISNAHHIKFPKPTPWNSSFESIFSKADSQFSNFVGWLESLQFKKEDDGPSFRARMLVQPISQAERQILAECVSSLITRSPCTRSKIQQTVEYYQGRMGAKKPKADKLLIAANLRHLFDAHINIMLRGGRLVVLKANGGEFIFGDGLLHNFPIQPGPTMGNFRCLVPITPTFGLLFVKPMQYPTLPELLTLSLSRDDLRFFSDTTQIYSRDFIFLREGALNLIEDFLQSEFRKYEDHKHPFLEQIIDAAVG